MLANAEMQINYDNLTIETCFKNFYIVPEYQREYVWEETQVSQLMEDLHDAYLSGANKQYFLGSLVVFKKGNNDFELIDGQQRITTFFLTLCAFRRIAAERGFNLGNTLTNMIIDEQVDENGYQSAKYRLELQYEDAKDCVRVIAENKNRPDEKDLSASGYRLFEAYDNIRKTLSSAFQDEPTLRKFYAFFIHKAIFIQICTLDISDALKIFETVNQRGVGLNPMDLLKNLIFRQVPISQFQQLNLKWKNIVDGLDKAGEKPLRFLRYFIMANYNIDHSKNKDGIVREDDIYNWFDKNNVECKYKEEPFAFVSLLQKCQTAYVNFLNGKSANGSTENVYLKNIKYLGGGAYKYHIMLLLPAREMPQNLFDYLCKQVEVLVYYVIMTKQGTNELERQFAAWASLIKAIKTKEELNLFLTDKLMPTVQSWKKTYRTWFMDVSQGNLQQYRIRYLLAKFAQYMDLQKQTTASSVGSLEQYIKKGVEVEHILPFTRSDSLKDKYQDETEYNHLKSRLGNLTLLEKVPNIVIGNDDFYSVKRPAYEVSAIYLTRSISVLDNIGTDNSLTKLNKHIRSWDKWDKTTIEERQEMLFDLSHTVWEIATFQDKN